jgi:serine/threonine protein phosphatase PrpC
MKQNQSIPNSLRSGYLATDAKIMEEKLAASAGSTSVTAIISKNSNGERWLYVANIGDARAVLW